MRAGDINFSMNFINRTLALVARSATGGRVSHKVGATDYNVLLPFIGRQIRTDGCIRAFTSGNKRVE